MDKFNNKLDEWLIHKPSMLTTICPNCGHLVQTRACLGSGTQRGKKMKVNENRQAIIEIIKESNKPLTVKEVQQKLWNKNHRRISRRGTGWNYHTVQADLSILLGMGIVEMKKPHELEIWDDVEGHSTNGIPLYQLKLNKLQEDEKNGTQGG